MNELYFIGNVGNGKYKHLGYEHKFERTIHTLCLPNIPIFCYHSCEAKKEGDGYEAGREEAEVWDEYFNEVSCPTCLKRARGNETQKQGRLL
jgi:hypothetical protein